MQLPPSKDFPLGELLGWAVIVEKGMLQEWLCYDDADVVAPCKLGSPTLNGRYALVYYGLWLFSVCRSLTVVGGA